MAVLRWVGAGVAVVVATLALVYALFDGLLVLVMSDCPLGLEFERTQAEVIEQRLVPPMVTCGYEYRSGDGGAALAPDEIVTYDATASWTVAACLTAGAATIVVLAVRRDARRDAPEVAEAADRRVPT